MIGTMIMKTSQATRGKPLGTSCSGVRLQSMTA